MSAVADQPGSAASSPFARIGIVGCGLIGGSLALAAGSVPGVEEVLLTDRDPQVRTDARRRGFGTVREDIGDLAADADLVILSIPVPAISSTAIQLLETMRPGTVLTDVGSVKSKVVREIESSAAFARARENGPFFVGGHPMAGSEREGLAASDVRLFEGATFILTPTARSSGEAFNRLAAFLRLIGTRVLAVDPDTHDRLVAAVSHLPQIVASTLMAYAAGMSLDHPGVLALAGRGFRDVTRIAASSPELWMGILRDNRDAVVDSLTTFLESLSSVRAAILGERWEEVAETFTRGRDARHLLAVKGTGGVPVDLVVPVEDRPGTLSVVTTALGAAGINIEDLAMRHAEEGGRGALVVTVAGEEVAERARQVLAERGFASHREGG